MGLGPSEIDLTFGKNVFYILFNVLRKASEVVDSMLSKHTESIGSNARPMMNQLMLNRECFLLSYHVRCNEIRMAKKIGELEILDEFDGCFVSTGFVQAV